jgi:hypothetical protein
MTGAGPETHRLSAAGPISPFGHGIMGAAVILPP